MKLAVITGSRAEYGLLRWILEYLKEDSEIDLQLIVTGMHLSHEFGYTVNEIINDGFTITKKVEMLLSSDTPTGISKSIGLGVISFSEVFEVIEPDLVLVLGDRFEIFSAATAAMIRNIPIAHIHGGESTEGLIDEAIRHSITKMSHIHFTSTEEYRKRVIQLGENPKNVFNYGAPGLDNINKINLLERKVTLSFLELESDDKYFLITFHPVTLEKNSSKVDIEELLKALIEFDSYKLVFTATNSDTDGRIILKTISDFVAKNKNRARLFYSLGQKKYLSTLKHAELLIGNSSSGIIETPSLFKPSINIGNRQKGRVKAKSVIDSKQSLEAIKRSIKLGISKNFQKNLKDLTNPYGKGDSSIKIVEQIKKLILMNC